MKKMLLAVFVSLISVSAFANLSECTGLMKAYTCTYGGQAMAMTLTQINDSTFSMTLQDQTVPYQVDGISHKAATDDSMEVGSCTAAGGIVINSSFKEETQTLSFVPTATGIDYGIQKPEGKLTLSCVAN